MQDKDVNTYYMLFVYRQDKDGNLVEVQSNNVQPLDQSNLIHVDIINKLTKSLYNHLSLSPNSNLTCSSNRQDNQQPIDLEMSQDGSQQKQQQQSSSKNSQQEQQEQSSNKNSQQEQQEQSGNKNSQQEQQQQVKMRNQMKIIYLLIFVLIIVCFAITISNMVQSYKQIDNINYKIDQIEKKIKTIYNTIQCNELNLKCIQKLRNSINEVRIYHYSDQNQYRQQIEQYEKNNTDYKIMIDFWYDIPFKSMERKMEMINMINKLNVGTKVGIVHIKVGDNQKQNDELIRIIMKRYTNVYEIVVEDFDDRVDSGIHGLIKQWIRDLTIFKFMINFGINSMLYSNEDGLGLVKEYNQLMRYEYQLEYLGYGHIKVGDDNKANSKMTVKQFINKVEKL